MKKIVTSLFKCSKDGFLTSNKKSWSNHQRWCQGMMRTIYPNFNKGEIGHHIKGINLGEKNGNWKGNNITLRSLHQWVARNKPKPELCERCKKVSPYDVANISQEYKKDINDYEWICRKCHMQKDGRLKKFQEMAHTGIGPFLYWTRDR